MTLIYLALGSNVGDSQANIDTAIKLLCDKIRDLKLGGVYRSKPVGYTEQPDFLNTAVSGETELTPVELFEFVKGIERQVGRIERFRWGPREIDIDIIFYGQQIVNSDKLTIPHPRFSERDFVLQPLFDLNPDLLDPATGKSIEQLLELTKTDGSATITPYADM